jgi:hypothetical protein
MWYSHLVGNTAGTDREGSVMEWLERLNETERDALNEMAELAVMAKNTGIRFPAAVFVMALNRITDSTGVGYFELSDYVWSLIRGSASKARATA